MCNRCDYDSPDNRIYVDQWNRLHKFGDLTICSTENKI